jgi:hypothetical protein
MHDLLIPKSCWISDRLDDFLCNLSFIYLFNLVRYIYIDIISKFKYAICIDISIYIEWGEMCVQSLKKCGVFYIMNSFWICI